ncbi:hypothetical protein V7S43_007807 [Phytophthora oleae]|uniref:Uncharacterized protein n=1 Tax=Phytophthora oleae TaxID=2107226 RepID=A0ABD3FIV9_9STRA
MLGWTEGAELNEEMKKSTKIKIKRSSNLKKIRPFADERLGVNKFLVNSTYEAEWITSLVVCRPTGLTFFLSCRTPRVIPRYSTVTMQLGKVDGEQGKKVVRTQCCIS